jgi:phenol 2-monooxygenase
MDMVPKTDFPDIRKVFVVHSAVGTIMGVPRENKLVRFYVSIDGVRPDAAAALESKGLTVEHIVDAASTIMAPYSMKAGSVVWWSAYRVGQRVADEFSRHERVFLAGDAVRTFTSAMLLQFADNFRYTLSQGRPGHEYQHSRW